MACCNTVRTIPRIAVRPSVVALRTRCIGAAAIARGRKMKEKRREAAGAEGKTRSLTSSMLLLRDKAEDADTRRRYIECPLAISFRSSCVDKRRGGNNHGNTRNLNTSSIVRIAATFKIVLLIFIYKNLSILLIFTDTDEIFLLQNIHNNGFIICVKIDSKIAARLEVVSFVH